MSHEDRSEQIRQLRLDIDERDFKIRDLEKQVESMTRSWNERGEVIDELVREIQEKDRKIADLNELLSGETAQLAATRRALKPEASEAPFPTAGIAVTRTERYEALHAIVRECLGFLSGLGYDGDLVRAVVALANRATDLKHERDNLKRAREIILATNEKAKS